MLEFTLEIYLYKQIYNNNDNIPLYSAYIYIVLSIISGLSDFILKITLKRYFLTPILQMGKRR